jgi:hypothetical protein
MPQAAALARALQGELAPVLHNPAAALGAALEHGANVDELATLPNIGLLLSALAGRTVAGGGKEIGFGEGNQFGDVAIGDVAMGSITKLALNVHIHHAAPLLSAVDALGAGAAPPDAGLAGGNGNGAVVAPTGADTKPRPTRVLVLDGDTGSQAAAALRLELRLRGMESPDPAPLAARTAQALRAELADADAAVLILSPASCAAAALRDRELPAAWGRYGQAAPFWLVPLIDGVAPEAAEVTLDIVGARLNDFRAIGLPADLTGRPGALAALAGLLLRSVVAPRLGLSVAAERPLALTLFSYPASGAVPPTDLALVWDALFSEPEQPTRRPPGPEIWRVTLDPALADVRLAVGAAHAGALSVVGRYHLPVGLALGFRIRSTVNVALHVAAQPGGVWQSDGPADEGQLLQREEQAGSSGASDISIEVSLARDVREDAGAYLSTAGIFVSKRIQLTSDPLLIDDINAARRFISSAAHARRLAAQIANVILSHKRGTIHLFAAVPQGLAVLIGANLNKVRPVQCYELFDDPDAGWIYLPAGTLR